MKTDALSRIYALILRSDNASGIKLHQNINAEWNITALHKEMHKEIGDMLREGLETNLMTIVSRMRESKGWNKEFTVQISRMTSTLSHLDQFNYKVLFVEMEYEYTKRRAEVFMSRLQGYVGMDNFSPDEYKLWLEEELKSSTTERVKEKSNVQIIFDVMDSHTRAKRGEVSGIQLGYSILNRVVLLEDVDMMVVGARPAMGKTAFAISTAIKCAFQQGLKVAFFALEMSKEQVMRRVLANVASVDSNRIKYGECNDFELSKINKVQEMEELSNIHIFEGTHTIKDIVSEVAKLKASGGIDIVIVDYLQKISSRTTTNRFDIVSGASNGLKSMAQNLHVPVLALAQLSRDSSKLGKRPSLPDLRESGDIEQDTSIVAFIHRPEYYGEYEMEDGNSSEGIAEFIIGKNREGDVGVYEMQVSLKTSKFLDSVPSFKSEVQTSDLSSLNSIRNTDENPF